MMARQVARQFCRLREAHSLVYGRRVSGKNGRKLTAGIRVGSQSRLMNYLGLMPIAAPAFPKRKCGWSPASMFNYLNYLNSRVKIATIK